MSNRTSGLSESSILGIVFVLGTIAGVLLTSCSDKERFVEVCKLLASRAGNGMPPELLLRKTYV